MPSTSFRARPCRVAQAAACLLSSASLYACAADIQGVIENSLGNPLADATLNLKAFDGKVLAHTRSDATGHFSFTNTSPGTYAIEANKEGFQAGTSIVTVNTANAVTKLTLSSTDALEVHVAAKRINQARENLSPKTGGSAYHFSADDVEALPEGGSTAFNQVLLQAPGVANDSFGQLHVRGDHGNLQYRINGIILPEGISGFGQALDSHFVQKIDLLTGALPAQYGYRTAGVIEIETPTRFEPGGEIGLYTGSRGTVNPSISYGNTQGNLSYYFTGSFLTSNTGIENPTSSTNAIHDRTDQTKGFAYLSYLLNPTTRLSAMLGTYNGQFQIPNNPGQTPDPDGHGYLAGLGISGFDSANLNERQHETNRYGIVALQSSLGGGFDYQVALFSRYTSTHFTPDPVGDLAFNGVASDVFRSSFSNGIQADGSYRLNDAHTMRMGLFASTETIRSDNSSTVFPVDDSGNVTGNPFTIVDNSTKSGNRLLGLYVQDEWKASDKLTVNYGLRADQVNAFVSAGQVSPRIGMVYAVTPQTKFHAAYARYFTPPPTELVSPQTISLFANTSNAPDVTQNDAVQAERSHYLDAGITHQVNSALSLGLDGFYKKVTNLLDEGQFGQALVFSPFNYAQGKIYGLELTASYKADRLSAYFNLARTTSLAKDINSAQFNFDQDELDYAATHWVHTDHDQKYTASMGVAYNYAGTEYSADAIYGSGLRRGFANTEHMPSYVQVNVGAHRKFETSALGNVDIRFAVINVFDRIYELRDGSGIGVGAPQYGPRRGLFLGLTKAF